MEIFTEMLTSVLRYLIPAMALIILARCVFSLLRNRPRVHKMAELVNIETGEKIDIDHWETSVGRSKSNDIVLTAPSVSRFHAVIAKRKKYWTITDTFSKAGIYIGGRKVERRQVLEDGDAINIGGVNFQFNCAEALSVQARSEMRTNARTNRDVAYAVLVDVETKRPVYLKKRDVLIGRGPACDIRLPFETVSHEHARIHHTSKGWALSDLDSRNGTKLNGRFITEPQLIFDDDMITFGERVFIFYEQ